VKPAIKYMLIAGIIGTLGPIMIGFLITIWGMIRAFHTLGSAGISDPQALANAIGTSLVATMAGIVVGMLGLVVFVTALILHFATKTQTPPPSPGFQRP